MKNLANALTFSEVAKQKSFVQAANQLGLSTSATSKGVARLEEELGVKLLHRTTRSVSLTPEGEEFLSGIDKLQSELNALTKEIKSNHNEPKGNLRLSVPPLWGKVSLLPMLPEFLARYPDISIDLSMEVKAVSLAADGCDIAVRAGELADSANLVARKITETKLLTCGSPNYLKQQGTPTELQELERHNCLTIRNPDAQRVRPWKFKIENQIQQFHPTGSINLDDFESLTQLVKQGVGLGQVYDFSVKKAIEEGQLLPVLSAYECLPVPIYAVYLDRRLVSPRIRAFIDFLLEKLG